MIAGAESRNSGLMLSDPEGVEADAVGGLDLGEQLLHALGSSVSLSC
jgi:hypothetical protein